MVPELLDIAIGLQAQTKMVNLADYPRSEVQ